MKNPQSDFLIFTFSECKDDLTGLFTSQPIAVVALSTGPVCWPNAPPLCPLAPHPPALQLPPACQAGRRQDPGQACQLQVHQVVGHRKYGNLCVLYMFWCKPFHFSCILHLVYNILNIFYSFLKIIPISSE